MDPLTRRLPDDVYHFLGHYRVIVASFHCEQVRLVTENRVILFGRVGPLLGIFIFESKLRDAVDFCLGVVQSLRAHVILRVAQ